MYMYMIVDTCWVNIIFIQYYDERYINGIIAMCKELSITKEDCIATVTGNSDCTSAVHV